MSEAHDDAPHRATPSDDDVTGVDGEAINRRAALRDLDVTRDPSVYDFVDDEDPTTGALDLADRAALRRVAGLGTELEDVTEVEYRQIRLERVVLIGVWTEGTLRDAERSLDELARLAETAGSVVVEALVQRRDRPDSATYVGSGKAKELRDVVVETGADTVIADGELTRVSCDSSKTSSRSKSSTAPG